MKKQWLGPNGVQVLWDSLKNYIKNNTLSSVGKITFRGAQNKVYDGTEDITVTIGDGDGGSYGTYDYNDLDNKPSINGVSLQGNKSLAQLGINLSAKADKADTYTKEEVNSLIDDIDLTPQADLSDYYTKTEIDNKGYATSSDLDSKANASDIPTKTSQLTNDSNYVTSQDISGKANSSDLATVATSGDYRDLSHKPIIPSNLTVDSSLSSTSTNAVQNKVITQALGNKQGLLASEVNIKSLQSANDTSSKISLLQSGTINFKTINDQSIFGTDNISFKTINEQSIIGTGNISIRAGEGTGGDANVIENIVFNDTPATIDESSKTATITASIPSSLSDLTSDSDHLLVTQAEKTAWNNKSSFSGSYTDLTNKPTIPDTSNFVALTGDQTIQGTKTFQSTMNVQGVKSRQGTGSNSAFWTTNGSSRTLKSILRVYNIYEDRLRNIENTSYNVLFSEVSTTPELEYSIIIDDGLVYSYDSTKDNGQTIIFKHVVVDLENMNITEKVITLTNSNGACVVSKDESYKPISSGTGYDNYFTVTSAANSNKIYFIADSSTNAKTIEWSSDKGNTWNSYTAQVGTKNYSSDGTLIDITYDSDNYIAELQNEEQILIRGNNSTYQNNWFASSDMFEVSGNIMSLCNSDPAQFNTYSTLNTTHTFEGLFKNCTYLYYVKNLILPSTVLTDYCYAYMFEGCRNLFNAPKLPATTMADHCYAGMFKRCTSLTESAELPATIMAKYCYSYMFSSSGLTTAPALPAKTLAAGCYYYMFEGTNITSTPALPATSMVDSCYMGMFSKCILLTEVPASLPGNAPNCFMEMFMGCIALDHAPALPSSVANENCYNSMFKNCTHLTDAPELPAIHLRSYSVTGGCYASMFQGCSGLKKAPELPATEVTKICYMNMFKGCYQLVDGPSILPAVSLDESYDNGGGIAYSCYRGMFQDCTRLENAPKLPALTLVKDCYREMFDGCMALDYIECLATDISANDCTYNWVNNVKSSGTFVKGKTNDWTTGVNGIPTNWTVETDPSQQYLTFDILTGGNITWTMGLSNSEAVTISYSKNSGSTWTDISSTVSIPVSAGDVLLFKGENTAYGNEAEHCAFGTSNGATFNVYGNAMSLIHGDDFIGKDTLNTFYGGVDSEGNPSKGWAYAFRELFKDCEGIRDASNLCLAATTLSTACYLSMFENSGITIAPKILPATNLATMCYMAMFVGCASLTIAPELPATTLQPGCYFAMFATCTSLTGTEDKAVVELPATKLTEQCYRNMFSDSGIIISPTLPASVLVNGCYYRMFYQCSSLKKITCAAYSISAEEALEEWTFGVASSGTFIADPNTNWSSGDNGIPSGWSRTSSSSANAKPNTHPFIDDEEEGTATPVIQTKFKVYTGTPVKDYLTMVILSDGIVKWNVDDEEYARTIQYSKDGTNWIDITSSESGETITVSEGEIVLLKGTAISYDHNYFSATAQFNLYGNICSLHYGNTYSNSLRADYGLRGLFQDCVTLISAEDMAMSAQPTNYGYQYMFKGCINLTKAPSLSSTIVSNGCYASMFENCISLTAMPSLPASHVYQYSYSRMFYGCTNLSSVQCLAKTFDANATADWLNGVSANGIFIKNSSATWETGTSGIPTNWTVETA